MPAQLLNGQSRLLLDPSDPSYDPSYQDSYVDPGYKDPGSWEPKDTGPAYKDPGDNGFKYPSDPTDPYAPVTRTWVGGNENHSATFGANWNPAGAPQAGDRLNFPQGSVDVQGYDLKGDTLYVGKPGEASQNTVNLSNQAQVNVDAVANSQPTVTFNVDSVAYVGLHNEHPSNASYVFNLHDGASVQSEVVDLNGSNLYLNGGIGFLNTGDVLLHSSNLYVHDDLQGTGHVQVGDDKWPGSHAEVWKSVSSGQSFDVVGKGQAFSDLYVNDPASFAGKVNLNDSYAVFGHVQADSYDLKNDLLNLYWKGNVVDSLNVNSSGDPLKVYSVAGGVMVDNSGFGSSATALPLHV